MGYDKNKVDEIVKLNKIKDELIQHIDDKFKSAQNPLTKFDDFYLGYIDRLKQQVLEKFELLLSSDNEEFDVDYLQAKSRLNSIIHELRMIWDNINKPVNESFKLVKILKEIIKKYKL